MLAGILTPSQGRILIDGKPVNPKRDNISFVFQEPSTFPWLTVWDNIATGLRIKRTPSDEKRRKVGEILDLVGLRGFEKHYPHQISGGMKQRVAIARAFATDADVILMDEPFVRSRSADARAHAAGSAANLGAPAPHRHLRDP